jgi:hypothetical protein
MHMLNAFGTWHAAVSSVLLGLANCNLRHF